MWGLALLLALLHQAPARAQASARVEIQATVVRVEPSRNALASARWLLARNGVRRSERGLATIVVSREKRRVAINYLRN